MGTDVHPYVEYKDGYTGKWKRAIVSLSRNRNYVSFAILANVRNGFGFGGIPTHETLIPIANPRGIPADTTFRESNDDDGEWLGDHSFSYVTLAELKAYDLNQSFVEQGVVSGADRDKVRQGIPPEEWCGGKSPMTENDEHMQWTRPLRDRAHLIANWIQRLKEWKEDNYWTHDKEIDGNLRIVFGFDS